MESAHSGHGPVRSHFCPVFRRHRRGNWALHENTSLLWRDAVAGAWVQTRLTPLVAPGGQVFKSALSHHAVCRGPNTSRKCMKRRTSPYPSRNARDRSMPRPVQGAHSQSVSGNRQINGAQTEHRLGAVCKVSILWSGRPDSNRRRPAWEAGILPLNYSRLPLFSAT